MNQYIGIVHKDKYLGEAEGIRRCLLWAYKGHRLSFDQLFCTIRILESLILDRKVLQLITSPKKTSPGRARALKVKLEPGPSLGPSEKVEPEP